MAAALVGGAFLSGALQVLFDRLAPKATIWNLFKTPNSNSKQLLRKLRNTLLFVSKLLDDAEKKEITDPNVKAWLDELNDVVYDADDLLAEIAYDIHATAVESASADARAGKSLASLDDLSWEGTEFQEKLGEILERLAELKEEKEVLLLEDSGQVNASNLPLERRTTSLVDESEVHGREGDKEAVTRLLMSEETNGTDGLGVIAIVGMGGLGKTTLTQLVYCQKEVSKKFQLKAWVCVSEETDVFLVTRNILKGFAPEVAGLESMPPDLLQTKLKDTLMGKRFLLVLDDVWNDKPKSWDILLQPLKHGLQGSRIIVTTRSTQVASLASTVQAYPLKELSEDACWLVFERCAFKGEVPSAYPDLVAIGRKIVAKCRGLPLAANSLGNLLRTRRDQTEWEWIMKSEMWNLEDRNILPALRLSYHYLSSSLKRCFAYCALFPKDYEFEIDELVRLWMAEGLLDSHKTKRPMEEIGADCFDALFSRSFFQKSSANSSRFVMHNLIHDLAKSVAGDFYHRLENDNEWLQPEKTRHLSYLSVAKYNPLQNFAGIYQSKSLRSFLPIRPSGWYMDQYMADDVVRHLFEASKRLRILSLSNYVNIKEIPESVGNLKLLRYLDLSRTSIGRLPDVVCKLCNLETLLLQDCKNLEEIPESIGNLKLMRYLDLSGTSIRRLPDVVCKLCNLVALWLENCENLEEVPDSIVDLKCLHFLNLAGTAINKLPINLCNLVNLCTLDIRRTNLRTYRLIRYGMPHVTTKLKEMPPKLGNLTRLQNLTDFFVGKGSSCSSMEELKELSKLKGKLCIWNLQNVVNAHSASGSNLKGKKNLKHLELSWEGDDADDSQQELKVLEELEPPCTLEYLTVRGYRSTKFPDWVGHCLFSNLISLTIEACKNCYEMPPVGQLESLKTLRISGCDGIVVIGPSFYGSSLPAIDKPLFDSLEVLHFEGMSEWIAWEQHDGAFPGLQELQLSNCPKLANALPGELPSLKKLKIVGCDQLVTPFPRAPAIVEVRLEDRNRSFNLHPSSGLRLSGIHNSSIDQILGGMQQCLGASVADLKQLEIGHSDLGTESCSLLEGVLKHFKCFDSLRIYDCWKVVNFPRCELASPTLTKLELHGLENLKSLPEQLKSVLPCLVDLVLSSCPELASFPEGGLPYKLESLHIESCKKLMAWRKQWNLQALPSLSSLKVGGEGYSFNETESFPEAMLFPSTLTTLFVWRLDGLKFLDYNGLQHLTSLQTLHIRRCNSLEKLLLEEEGLLPQSLISILIWELRNLKSLSPIQRLTSLASLSIHHCDKVVSDEVALPSTITSLRVKGMKMKSLDGWGLQRLTCLGELHISFCLDIESITEEEALPFSLRDVELRWCARLKSIQRGEGFPSLGRLRIEGCPLLAEKYQWEGQEWHCISYIPDLRIV